jgi:hypothetical protein
MGSPGTGPRFDFCPTTGFSGRRFLPVQRLCHLALRPVSTPDLRLLRCRSRFRPRSPFLLPGSASGAGTDSHGPMDHPNEALTDKP